MHLQYRRIVFTFLRALTRISSTRYRFIRPSWLKDFPVLRLNLGSGREPLPGWINIDINPFSRCEICFDIRDPWPIFFTDVDAIYFRHCLEHFMETEVLSILAKCHRVLGTGKGMRIGVPSLEFAIQQYQNADFSFAPWATDHANSPGRQFFSYIMDNGAHGIMLDYGYLAELLEISGFRCIEKVSGGKSNFLDLTLLSPKDNPADVTTLYVECRK
jgi:predicted SAM-dependent methyltransferase